MKWQRSIPVSFQAFNNHQFQNNATTCNKRTTFWSQRAKAQSLWGKSPMKMNEGSVWLHPYAFPDLCPVALSVGGSILPRYVQMETCTLLLLSNLAEAEWISINCSQKLLPHILCAQNTNKSFQANSSFENHESVENIKSCFSGDIIVNGTCYMFVWFSHLPHSQWKKKLSTFC